VRCGQWPVARGHLQCGTSHRRPFAAQQQPGGTQQARCVPMCMAGPLRRFCGLEHAHPAPRGSRPVAPSGTRPRLCAAVDGRHVPRSACLCVRGGGAVPQRGGSPSRSPSALLHLHACRGLLSVYVFLCSSASLSLCPPSLSLSLSLSPSLSLPLSLSLSPFALPNPLPLLSVLVDPFWCCPAV
jgi:hypothetical protein